MPLDSTSFEPEVVRDLRAGRAYLVEHGWVQNRSRDGERVCAIGALLVVVEDQVACSMACGALERALGGGPAVGHWNDVPGRTIEDVLALYDRAIEREMAGVGG